MAGKPMTELSEKHWKALKLFKEGGQSQAKIAEAIGVSVDYLGDLARGETKKAGQVALIFQKEWQKIKDDREENIQHLTRENTEAVQTLINRVAKELITKKKLTHPEKRLLAAYNNTLTVSKQSVNIKNLSYSYTQGLSAVDLAHEFTKLKGIAEGSFDRRPHANKIGRASCRERV